jgi:hypothetical protein
MNKNKNKNKKATQIVAPATTSTITLAQLTPEQLLALKGQLKAEKKAKSSNRVGWVATVDKCLQEKELDGTFKNTTADILEALQIAKVWNGQEREVELKKVQTRKQLLVKKDQANKLKYGYKTSEHGFSVTRDRACIFLDTASTSDLEYVAEYCAVLLTNAK